MSPLLVSDPGHRLFSFGIISDIQYADIPDGFSFNGVPRFYRASLRCLRQAVTGWKKADVDFCIHMGDIIDGFNPPHLAGAALDRVVAEFAELGEPHYHMLGNHCLYNLSRQTLNAKLRMGGPTSASYYSFEPHKEWKFIVLDGYDVSMLGWPPGHPLHEQAKAVLDERNPNEDKNNPTRPAGVSQTERRFVKFGGGLSDAQLEWLVQQCQSAREQQQRVVIFGHLPLHPETCYNACLLWNYDRVLQVVHDFRDVCVATFTGHAHNDGSITDADGVHHRVLNAVVETPEGDSCSGIISVFHDRLELIGDGSLASASLSFRP